MSLRIRLLGPPTIDRDGELVRLPGRKTWALLAMLAIDARPVGRTELIERLTTEADDPQAAFRWLLHTVRRALAGEARIVEDRGRLQLVCSADAHVDVMRLIEAAPDAGDIADLVGELLGGLTFDDSPATSFWLTMERARIRAVAAEALWFAATTIASSDSDGAMRLVRHGISIDPYCETKHELLIDLLLQRGDVLGARAHAEAVRRLFRDELGVEVPASISRPLERRHPGSMSPAGPSARALMPAAEARFIAGDVDRAVETARRAADEALRAEDPELELAALFLLSRILIHGNRGRHVEAKGLLSRAAQLASQLGDRAALADVQREMGYVFVIDGSYGSADPLLARSRAFAMTIGDTRRAAQAQTYHAMSRSDQCDFEGAASMFQEALHGFTSIDDGGWRGYAEAMAARALVRSGETAAARTLARQARERIRTAAWSAVLAWPILVEAESFLRGQLAGDGASAAADGFSEALELSIEIGDPCCESLALRGLGLTRDAHGDRQGAIELLEQAHSTSLRFGGIYAWAQTVVLVDLVELQRGEDPQHVESGFRLATAGPMPDLAARLLPWRTRGMTQTRLQTAAV